MIKVSVIITTHNRVTLLKRAVNSVLAQSYKNIELIIVNDASTDETNDYLKSLTNEFDVVNIFIDKSRGGNYARNVGIKASTGEYIAFLDDDDYYLPDKIKKQMELIEDKGYQIVHCAKRIENILDGRVEYRDEIVGGERCGDLTRKVLYVIPATTSCLLCSKQLLFDVGLFDENLMFWQEYELSIRLAQICEFGLVNEPLVVYRIDVGDKNRLTNKYYGWKKAVEYIHMKHKLLYDKLDFSEKMLAKRLEYYDAAARLALCNRKCFAKVKICMAKICYIPHLLKKYNK